MATLGILRLTSKDFVIYRDSVDFVSAILSYVTTDWKEYQEHLRHDPDAQPFHTEADHAYVVRIMPLWTAFLQLPMFEVKVETPGAPGSGVHRTVAHMINRVQAKEWMLPLSPTDHEMHQKV